MKNFSLLFVCLILTKVISINGNLHFFFFFSFFQKFNLKFVNLYLGALSPQIEPGEFPSSIVILDGNMEVYWKIDNFTIIVGLTAACTGWLGFGIGQNMINADMIMGYVDSTGVSISDFISFSNDPPKRDLINNILEFSGEEVNGQTTIKFSRYLVTGDYKEDKPIVNLLKPYLFAFQEDSDSFYAMHTFSTRVTVDLNLYDVQNVTYNSNDAELALVHGILMIFAWMFCTVIGQFLARFFKYIGVSWFLSHIGLNSIAIISILISFILVLIAANESYLNAFIQGNQLIILHAWVGMIIIVLALVQPVIGFLADKYWKADRIKTPFWPDKVHWYIGRGTQFLALLNIVLGMYIYQSFWYYYLLYFIWLFLIVVAYVVLYMREKHSPQEIEMVKFLDEE